VTKEELQAIVDRVSINWNVYEMPTRRKGAYKVWWHFLSDLDFDLVSKYVDERALAGDYPPRPGDVRGELIYRKTGIAPPTKQAWVEFQKARSDLESGVDPGNLDPIVAKTMKEMGRNNQRDVFFRLYDDNRGEYFANELDSR